MELILDNIVYDLNLNKKIGSVKFAYPNILEANIRAQVKNCTIDTIEQRAFYHCEKLKKVLLPTTIKNIKNEAFANCYNLNKVGYNFSYIGYANNSTFFHENLKVNRFGNEVFKNCKSLTNMIFSNETEFIGNGLFLGCNNLKKVMFNSNVTVIPKDVFTNCTNLEEVSFNHKVTKINNAFSNCNNLKTLYIQNPKVDYRNFLRTVNKNVTFILPKDSDLAEILMFGYNIFLIEDYDFKGK